MHINRSFYFPVDCWRGKLLLCLQLLILGCLPSLGNAAPNTLEKIGYSTLPGNKVQITLDFAEGAQKPISFATDNPARIVLDFPNTHLNLGKKFQPIGAGMVQGASAVETSDRTRVVLSLIRNAAFNVEVSEKRVFISVEGAASPTTLAGGDAGLNAKLQNIAKANPENNAVLKTANTRFPSIQNIDYRRTAEGAGRLIVSLSDPSTVVNMREEGKSIVVEFQNTSLPEKLDRRLDVVDFATPVNTVDTLQQGNNVRMVLTASGEFEHLAYQAENTYVVEVKKVIENEQDKLKKKQPVYNGQKVSFNFQNIEVRSALLLLTDLPGLNLNMVTSDQVTGSMSLRLKNVPWDQALDIILEARGLGKRQLGNVIMIDTKESLAIREKNENAALQEIKKVEPVRTEYVQVNYAQTKDLATLIGTKDSKTTSLLSERGSVTFDERTNTLIVRDIAENLASIRELVASLDKPSRQVLIESRVVIANNDFSKSLGVKFGYSTNQALAQGQGIVIGGKNTGDTSFSGGTAFTTTGGTSSAGGAQEGYIVSLPATGMESLGTAAALGLVLGKVGTNLLQLELSALQAESLGEVISNPRVITANNRKAVIMQGSQIPYTGVAGVGATAATQFKDVVLKLEVKPQITPDDRIIMDLKVTKDTPGANYTGGVAIDKREVDTQVFVDNGETVVLGGVYEQRKSNQIQRIPFFSDIPLIGELFKRRYNLDNNSELLIFITPKIIKENS
jgi:type IV pilus assembly protein PilQ